MLLKWRSSKHRVRYLRCLSRRHTYPALCFHWTNIDSAFSNVHTGNLTTFLAVTWYEQATYSCWISGSPALHRGSVRLMNNHLQFYVCRQTQYNCR